jgi:hypothetical protein
MDGGPTNLKFLLKEHPPGPGSACQCIVWTSYSVVKQMPIPGSQSPVRNKAQVYAQDNRPSNELEETLLDNG